MMTNIINMTRETILAVVWLVIWSIVMILIFSAKYSIPDESNGSNVIILSEGEEIQRGKYSINVLFC